MGCWLLWSRAPAHDGIRISRKANLNNDVAVPLTVLSVPLSSAGERAVSELQTPVSDPIDLDRSRQMPAARIAWKPAPMLDVLALTVFLTVSDRTTRQNARRDKDLAAQLMIEWE